VACLAIALIAVVVAACSDGDPSYDTQAPVSTIPSNTTSTTAAAQTIITLYWVRGNALGVSQRLEATKYERFAALKALFAGPKSSERDAGLITAIPSGSILEGVSVVNGIAYVNVNANFFLAASTTMMYLRMAQVVYTLTAQPGVTGVQFLAARQRLATFDGVKLDAPVTRTTFSGSNGLLLLETPAVGDSISSPLQVGGVAQYTGTLEILLVDSGHKPLVVNVSDTAAGESFAYSFPYTPGASGDLTLKLLAVRASGGTTQLVANLTLPQAA
jgi:hypothetical protein